MFIQNDQTNFQLINKYLKKANFNHLCTSSRLESYSISDIALAKSGTNTLEIAASKTPQIIGYKINVISYLIIKAIIKIKFVSLINIISGKEIIPEYIQSKYNVENLSTEIIKLLSNTNLAQKQVNRSQDIIKQMGCYSETKPTLKTAQKIIELLS